MNRLYAYLYDDFLTDAVFQKSIASIETRASVLGIQGRTSRLAIFRSARELIAQLVRDGAETIVVVGNDKTLQKVMWFLPDLPVTLGYLPVAEPCAIARTLGIPIGDAACDVLAARRVEPLDIGRIGDRYFLTEAVLAQAAAAIRIGAFCVRPLPIGSITIRNLGLSSGNESSGFAATGLGNAKDGWLELVVRPNAPVARTGWAPFTFSKSFERVATELFIRQATIESKDPVDVVVDGQSLNGFGFSVGIIPRKLHMITGRPKGGRGTVHVSAGRLAEPGGVWYAPARNGSEGIRHFVRSWSEP